MAQLTFGLGFEGLSASSVPTGPAGGDLNGFYPSPGVNDGADATAIHDNIAGEIAAIAQKLAPVFADLLLIEDSAAGNAKKRIEIGDIPPQLAQKSGIEINANFAGNPRTATVVFATAFGSTNYSVSLAVNGTASFAPYLENIAVGSFDINMDVNNINNMTDIRWIAIENGETT